MGILFQTELVGYPNPKLLGLRNFLICNLLLPPKFLVLEVTQLNVVAKQNLPNLHLQNFNVLL